MGCQRAAKVPACHSHQIDAAAGPPWSHNLNPDKTDRPALTAHSLPIRQLEFLKQLTHTFPAMGTTQNLAEATMSGSSSAYASWKESRRAMAEYDEKVSSTSRERSICLSCRNAHAPA